MANFSIQTTWQQLWHYLSQAQLQAELGPWFAKSRSQASPSASSTQAPQHHGY